MGVDGWMGTDIWVLLFYSFFYSFLVIPYKNSVVAILLPGYHTTRVVSFSRKGGEMLGDGMVDVTTKGRKELVSHPASHI